MKKQKKKENVKKRDITVAKPTTLPSTNSDEKPFDFGGLPDRDLKKNLGCG